MAPPSSASRSLFSGEFRHALDSKNRITIPSRWRQGDNDEFFLIPNPLKACLTAMPHDVFQSLGEDANAKTDPAKRQDFIRHLYSQAQTVTVDKQGRLLVPEDQCRAAGLRGEVVIAGARDRFEIWTPSNWAKFRETEQANFLEVAKAIGL